MKAINQPIHKLRPDDQQFCSECDLSFVIAEESEVVQICKDCDDKLGHPKNFCDDCNRAILPGKEFFLGYSSLCEKCAKRDGLSKNTIAWSRDE